MKNRFIVVYTVFAAAVFIFALSFFGFNLYKEYSTNLEKSVNNLTYFSHLKFAQAFKDSLCVFDLFFAFLNLQGEYEKIFIFSKFLEFFSKFAIFVTSQAYFQWFSTKYT